MVQGDPNLTPDDAKRLKALYGLDRPILERYGAWLGNAVQGEFGYSRNHGQPVVSVVGDRIGNTALLLGISLILALGMAIPVGIYAALKPYSPLDYIINMAWDRGGTTTSGFYWNRVARIAPLYYLMLVLSYIFQWSMGPDELNVENFIWHLFFAHGFSGSYAYAGVSPMWSLTSEITFYLVFPFLNRLSTRWLLVALAASLLFGDVDTGMAYWLTGSTLITFTPLGAAKFMLGGMIVYRHRDVFASRRAVILSGIFAAIMATMMLGTLLALEFEAPVDVPKSLVLLGACPFLMFAQIPLLRIALENAVARHLGLVSYSIYLWQLPIIQELQKHGWLVDALTLTAIVVAVGTLSYVLIEKPFLTWFRAGQPKPATVPAGAVKSAA